MKNLLSQLQIMLFTILLSLPILGQPIPADSMYLGQIPPGNTPKIFNLPINSGLRPIERIAISSDGTEIYYGVLNTYPPTTQKTKYFKYIGNRWQGPFPLFELAICPRLTPNDSILYTMINEADFSTAYRSVRLDSGWSQPVKLLSHNQQSHYFQTTGLNNSYLSSNLPSAPSHRDICKLIINGSDSIISSLGAPINSSFDENDFYIADDEAYMIFSRNNGSGGDMYLSFKKESGGWTNPKKFGAPINGSGYSWEYGQFISKDKKYLFYTRGGSSMSSYYTYWVKIDNIIDSMKHTNYIPYVYMQIPAQSAEVNKAFQYTFPDSTFIDDDGNSTLTYAARLNDGSPLPSWLSFNPATRTLTGTPNTAGNITVKIVATDSANVTVSSSFSINAIINGTDDSDDLNPKEIRLLQNYPNPFNPETTIDVELTNEETVSLKVYDLQGREIAKVYHGSLTAGRHSFNFNARDLASGAYMCILTSNSFSAYKKLIVMK